MKSTILSRLLPLALAAGFLPLLSCGGGGSTTVGGGGNGGGGSDGTFRLAALEGDWLGQLVPSALGARPRNSYARFVGGEFTEAAESDGGDWNDAVAALSFTFTTKGVLKTNAKADASSSRLQLTAQMDKALTSLAGTFILRTATGQKVTGNFTFTRSAGSTQFDQSMLTGRWDGLGTGSSGKFRFLKLDLDAAGVVTSGLLKHPDTQLKIRNYSNGAGTFTFFDSSVGRLNNVVVTSDGGATITFNYLLLDVDRTALSGPGVESGLGSGIAELVPGI